LIESDIISKLPQIFEKPLLAVCCIYYRLNYRCGFNRIWVVAKPTGIYHRPLFRTAKRLGLSTQFVSAESVAKMRVIETNDTGKPDIKDPHVIHTLASMGKTLKHRSLPEPYSLLRQWNKMYDKADKRVVKAKACFRTMLKELFSDFNKSTKFILSNSGRAVMENYKYNPYRILGSGKSRYKAAMKKMVPRIKNKTLDEIFEFAQTSVINKQSFLRIDIFEVELIQCWQDLYLFLGRKQQAVLAMEALYEESRCLDPKLPSACKGVITSFHLARFIAETGPLSDFDNCRKLMRFAGLNLCERQSGNYKGKTE